MGRRGPKGTGRDAESARRLYARVLVEHERVRRVGARSLTPNAPLWKPLHDLAFFSGGARRRAALSQFCTELSDAEGVPRSVPPRPYLAALRVALDLAADRLVQAGGQTPWGQGQPRVPESPERFAAVCRALRDLDESGAVAEILDDAESPPAQEPRGPRVVFDVPSMVLTIGGAPIALPEGREYQFLRLLAERRKKGEVTPTEEHGLRWKNSVDKLRQRIRKATGRNLLASVVLNAKPPVGGYRLAPDVEVTGDREVEFQSVSPEMLDWMTGNRSPRRKPKGRDLRGESDDD